MVAFTGHQEPFNLCVQTASLMGFFADRNGYKQRRLAQHYFVLTCYDVQV